MAFGLSGATDKSQMIGADVTIAYMDGARGFANDYNVTATAPVSKNFLNPQIPNLRTYLTQSEYKKNKVLGLGSLSDFRIQNFKNLDAGVFDLTDVTKISVQKGAREIHGSLQG